MTLQLIFFDTEDSDLDETPEQAARVEIIEYAAVRWTDGNAQPLCHEYVMPRHGCQPGAAKVNGYSEELWRERSHGDHFKGVDADNLCEALDQGTTGIMIAGSNPDFDVRMVKREFDRICRKYPNWAYRNVNTASASIFLYMTGVVENTKLATLAAYFGHEEQRHNALDDCYSAIKVFEGLHDIHVYQPKVMREGLLEIANDEATDKVLRDYALALAEGRADVA